MSEQKSFFDMSSKQGMVIGLAIGIAAVSLIGYFSTMAKDNGDDPVNTNANTNTNINANVNNNQPPTPPSPPPTTSDVTKLNSVLADAVSIGPDDAKVTVIEVSEFQCPFCSRHNPTMDQIMSEYEGKIKRIWIHFPLTSIHPNAMKASESVECANEQGKFWELHDKIFENQSAITVDNIKTYAKEIGLDTASFNTCLDEGKYANKIKQQMAAASAAGVTGTPGTFVNGELVKGAYPFDTFKQLIDAELAK